MSNPTPQEQVETLAAKVEERNAKIVDVNDRIARQKDHILKTQKKKERFEEHRARWKRQNDRDLKKIAELQKKHDLPRIEVQEVVATGNVVLVTGELKNGESITTLNDFSIESEDV